MAKHKPVEAPSSTTGTAWMDERDMVGSHVLVKHGDAWLPAFVVEVIPDGTLACVKFGPPPGPVMERCEVPMGAWKPATWRAR